VPETGKEHSPSQRNSLCVVGAEALLIVLPFLVMTIVQFEKGQLAGLLYMPDWGVAASALIGLAMVRFATGLLHGRAQVEHLEWERVLLLFSLIVVFAFVPALLVLSLVLLAKTPSPYLAALQLILFVVGLFLFIALGWAGQHVIAEATESNARRNFQLVDSRAAGD
jgi:hypothetical protein